MQDASYGSEGEILTEEEKCSFIIELTRKGIKKI